MSCNNCNVDTKKNELKKFIDSIEDREHLHSYLIQTLHKAQGIYGYLPEDTIKFIADELGLKVPRVWSVVTFYHYFKLKPSGKHIISVCLGTACYVKGAESVLNAIKTELGIVEGETTKDKMFTLFGMRCVGACGRPVCASL